MKLNQKWNSPILTIAISVIFQILMIPNSFPQVGGVNGGDPNEVAEFVGVKGEHLPSWFEVKTDLIKGFDLNFYKELKLGNIDQKKFKADVLEALKTIPVEFDNKEIIVNGITRPCENYKDPEPTFTKHIHCNSKAFADAMSNYSSETEYKMISHEYFSVSGYEPNEYGVSAYPLSSQISKKLKNVMVKKWAIKAPKVKQGETPHCKELRLSFDKKFNFLERSVERCKTEFANSQEKRNQCTDLMIGQYSGSLTVLTNQIKYECEADGKKTAVKPTELKGELLIIKSDRLKNFTLGEEACNVSHMDYGLVITVTMVDGFQKSVRECYPGPTSARNAYTMHKANLELIQSGEQSTDGNGNCYQLSGLMNSDHMSYNKGPCKKL